MKSKRDHIQKYIAWLFLLSDLLNLQCTVAFKYGLNAWTLCNPTKVHSILIYSAPSGKFIYWPDHTSMDNLAKGC